MRFRVIDNKTGKEADPYEIALHEEWAQGLVYCDMEGFLITENGDLMLADECGTYVYCDTERFNVVFEDDRPHGEWIFHKYDKDYECSNCHVRFDRTQIYTEKRFENALWAKMEIYNFCPNCGASMVKEGEAE